MTLTRRLRARTIALAAALVFAVGSCGGEIKQAEPEAPVPERAEASKPLHGVTLGMSRESVEALLRDELPESKEIAQEHLGNQSRIRYGDPSNPRAEVVVHFEDLRVVEALCPATGERLPPEAKTQYALSVGMTESACDLELLRTPGVQRYFAKKPDPLGCIEVIYGNPRDAKSTIVVTVKEKKVVDARWFGTGESLIANADK